MVDDPDWLSTREAARILGVSLRRVQELARRGDCGAELRDGRWFLRRSEVEARAANPPALSPLLQAHSTSLTAPGVAANDVNAASALRDAIDGFWTRGEATLRAVVREETESANLRAEVARLRVDLDAMGERIKALEARQGKGIFARLFGPQGGE